MKSQIELNKSLNYFTFCKEIGYGLPILTNSGTIIKEILRNFIRTEEFKRGYHHVETPVLGLKNLYETSQHATKYANDMFPSFASEGEEYVMRSVTCPNHYMMFKSELRSYTELPLRYTEMSTLVRRDMTGELTGIFRANSFTLNDAHIFCSRENVKEEYASIIDFIKYVVAVLGLSDSISYRLSLGDENFNNQKFIVKPELWREAEGYITDIMNQSGVEFFSARNKACHYGPKLDVLMKRYSGKPEIIITVQLDFILPELFDVYFANKKQEKERPVVIHRALPFSMERTIGFLMEHYQGDLPFWLTPEQVIIIPFSEDSLIISRAEAINALFLNNGIRSSVNHSTEKYNKKVKKAIQQKVGYIVLIGNDELTSDSITMRNRLGEKQSMNISIAIDTLKKQNFAIA
ncbi:threonine-trna ligase [Holotrichia oblita]|uniref:Threonine-trna ligase n=1 Tax=Holotrichia oblita TaxID=644536 RepID=A0ACB9T4D2_HOLOL|nr:threonine-trna ligase [Holotrichia oblita]